MFTIGPPTLGLIDSEVYETVPMSRARSVRRVLAVFVSLLIIVWLVPVSSQDASTAAEKNGNVRGVTAENAGRGHTKMELDVRDEGVDCTFTRDSSAALNSITASTDPNGRAVTFPPGC